MMDYSKTRTEAEARKQILLARQQEIPREKQKLDEEMEQIKRELIGIEQILDGLGFMDSDVRVEFEPSGFTDSVRKILSETMVPLVPTQIRDALEAKGMTGSTSKNLLINVHKVLERISDELKPTKRADGKTAYQRKVPWVVNPWNAALLGMSATGPNDLPRLQDLVDFSKKTKDVLSSDHPVRQLAKGSRLPSVAVPSSFQWPKKK
jgi:hypothetical protein